MIEPIGLLMIVIVTIIFMRGAITATIREKLDKLIQHQTKLHEDVLSVQQTQQEIKDDISFLCKKSHQF